MFSYYRLWFRASVVKMLMGTTFSNHCESVIECTVRASQQEKKDISISQNFLVYYARLTKVLYQEMIALAKR